MRRFALLPVLLATLLGAPPAHAWTWPVDGPVLRPFLFGSDPYAAGLHRGIDIGAVAGSAVRAPRAGLVRFAGTVPGNGRTVTIETADGYSVTLLHLGAFSVARGATVAEGDAVAVVGPSDGVEHAVPSVHLGVRVTDDPQGYVDPLPLLPAGAPAAPEASEPESPVDPEPNLPETPSEEPGVSEPEPPVTEEPAGAPPVPVEIPAASVPDLAHTPAVGPAPEQPSVAPSVPQVAAIPVPQPHSTPVAQATRTAPSGEPREASGRPDISEQSRVSLRTPEASDAGAWPSPAPASRTTERPGLPWRLSALSLGALLLAGLIGMRRRLVGRCGHSIDVSAPVPEPRVDEAREVVAFETDRESRRRPHSQPRRRPDPDRSGPRPERGRAAARRRSARQPVSAVGTRRRR